MAEALMNYYFTDQDPDYTVKGSREPLGFQVIWQASARKLIPYLSTVSNSVIDFQILCLSYYFYEKPPDAHFINFFIRFEQLMAYARYQADDKRFNGVDKVRKFLNSDATEVRLSNKNEILSNQRAYGIWGKYNRPFRDIGFLQTKDFQTVFDEKISSLSDKNEILKIIQVVKEKSEIFLTISDLEVLKPLFTLNKAEANFYTKNILQVSNSKSFQNTLFDFLGSKIIAHFPLYTFLNSFKDWEGAQDPELQKILEEIAYTERVISPLINIFRYLPSKPLWSRTELVNEPFINQCKVPTDYRFAGETVIENVLNELSEVMKMDNWKLIEKLCERNAYVSKQRSGLPWLSINGDFLEIHYADGVRPLPDYDPLYHYNNNYFLDSYVNLFASLNN